MDGSRPSAAVDLKGLPASLGHLARPIKAVARQIFRDHAISTYALSLTFLGDPEIARLNRRSLGRKGPTDVIAFDLSEAGLPYELVGDIYISLDRARAASRTFKVSVGEEIVRLAVHGMLHLVGHRDGTGRSRRSMELAQERMVGRFSGKRRGRTRTE
jgi:probable rRNA maturation factor